jgi:DNA mismatch endonuclease, patch repair protein
METPSATSRRMRGTRGRDNPLERSIRSRLFELNYRFRVHYPIPGLQRRSCDIAFPRRRLAIFIDGCFWHGCPLHGTWPKTNSEFWKSKIERNRTRDEETSIFLGRLGWNVLRVWEHEIITDVLPRITETLAKSIRSESGTVR